MSTEDIEALFVALEAGGRRVSAGAGGRVEAHLGRVVAAARSLRAESASRPTLGAVCERSGLTRDEVLGALYLLRIMQR